MAERFFNSDMELFIDHRVDWERLFRLRRGPDGQADAELGTYHMIPGTAAQV